MINKIEDHIKNIFSFSDEETVQKLISTAIVSLKKEKQFLINLLENENKEDILQTVHKLKGLLLNSGLAELAKEFEEEKLKKMELLELKKSLKESLEKIELD